MHIKGSESTENLIKYIFSRSVLHKNKECVIWTGAVARKHGMLTGGFYVHREVFKHFKGEIPKGLIVAHTCDRGLCVRPCHLEAITRRQNILDAFERHMYERAKYTTADVIALRNKTMTLEEFSKRFDVTIKTAFNIRGKYKVKWR